MIRLTLASGFGFNLAAMVSTYFRHDLVSAMMLAANVAACAVLMWRTS